MRINFEQQNLVLEEDRPEDALRGELGTYYTINQLGALEPVGFTSGKILSSSVTGPTRNDNLLIPSTTHTINFYGREDQFRDQLQWKSFVSSLVDTSSTFEDHTFIGNVHERNVTVKNNYHDPRYEDYTKIYDTNHLLNYNLMNYKFNNEVPHIKTMSLIKSTFDSPTIEAPNSDDTFKQLVFEYPERIENYSGSLRDLDRKQRHIFKINKQYGNVSNLNLPYILNVFSLGDFQHRSELYDLMTENRMGKFILQSIKSNSTFRNIDFAPQVSVAEQAIEKIKAHDLTGFVLNNNTQFFDEKDDELFLLEEDDLNPNHISNRFVNQVRAIRFLQGYREILKMNEKNYHDILRSRAAKTFRIGYKIQKYYLNDATLPVQTYYISDHSSLLSFLDSQLKYGDRYIYKFYDLIAVLGTTHSYSDLYITNTDGQLQSADDQTIRNYGDSDFNKKYRARVNVRVAPSFQVFETKIMQSEKIFFDSPTLPPQVNFYNEMNKKNNVMFSFRTSMVSSHDPNYNFKIIGPNDKAIRDKINLSRDNVYGTVFDTEYFTGRYEIYRMETPPKKISDFEDHFLIEVDQTAEILSKKLTPQGDRVNYTLDYPNASYEDVIQTHQKYYYLFRTLTYHGTPSNHTEIFEVELLEDSDETKLIVKEYRIPEIDRNTDTKAAKRLLKIMPNLEQIMFDDEEYEDLGAAINNLGTLEKKLYPGGTVGKKFKIRITSKHTGKKMDINLTFRIKDNFLTE
jgi:hypothetical protein